MKRFLRVAITLSITLILIWVLNVKWGTIPPLGKLLDPFAGFWQQAGDAGMAWQGTTAFLPVKEPVQVVFDDRMIPHIFAQNDEDLYLVQGYVEARDRLWQMDFMSRLAMGRVAEIAGPDALPIDRYFRRLGMPKAIANSMAVIEKDPVTKMVMEAYTKGVNAYISQLSYKAYPLEFKLLDYPPSPWTIEKSVAILKLMAFNLTGGDRDVELTNALAYWGAADFRLLYPDYPKGILPIIPDSQWSFAPIAIDTPEVGVPKNIAHFHRPKWAPHPMNGSNNWAVSPQRSATGFSLLANDPHLGLNIPAIWYEQQHITPTCNTYGVSIPGVPIIVLGFNEHFAWGFTNAGRDVKDWYQLEVNDEGTHYKFDGEWRPFTLTAETIQVAGGPTFYDTIKYTHFGPVSFDTRYTSDSSHLQLAMHWQAYAQSNEVLALYHLNRATNMQAYAEKIATYGTPAQNIVYADRKGNIALIQQGHFPALWPGQGRFVGDGSKSSHQWQATIPNAHNPKTFNPQQGFISSANQHATYESYPYYYQGRFEYYRNRRINALLANDSSVTLKDMMAWQQDNYSIKAREALAIILPHLSGSPHSHWISALSSWDYRYEKESEAAVQFEFLWKSIVHLIADEYRKAEIAMTMPGDYNLIAVAREYPAHRIFDIDSTATIETWQDIVTKGLDLAVKECKHYLKTHQNDSTLTWAAYKNTSIIHWMRAIPALNITGIPVGGHGDALNAMSFDHGPSWRLIAEMRPEGVKAYGIYPGGQSGNPGSPHYGQFVDKWARGGYYPLLQLTSPTDSSDRIIGIQTFK